MHDTPLLSVVIPMFNEEGTIPLLLPLLIGQLAPLGAYEILCVDDGSRDNTRALLQRHAAQNTAIRYISFARNFGHQAALKAGLDHARGQAVITMDADLQHPPELIAGMVERWRQGGAQVIQMVRKEAGEPVFKRLTSRFFYGFINRISDFHIEAGAADFRLLDRKVVDALKAMPERNLFLRGTIPWLGFTQLNLPYMPAPRAAGQTKYSLARMLGLAVSGITSASIRPLRLATFAGLVMATLSLVYGVYAVFVRFFLSSFVPGWASLLAGMMLIGGVQLLILGLIGEYIGKILIEVKDRPAYIIREQGGG